MTTTEYGMADDETRIDRLVDGELNDRERRALLTQFALEPDGWRRCALAFLEAQTWRDAVSPVARAASTQSLAAPAKSAIGHHNNTSSLPRRTSRLLAPLAAAACLAVYGLGWLSAVGLRAIKYRAIESTLVASSRPSGQVSRSNIETAASSTDPLKSAASPRAPRSNAALGLAGRSTREGHRLASSAGPLPESVVRGLEQRGIQVETRRGVVTLPLKDGRHVAFPVGAMKLRYVGNRTI